MTFCDQWSALLSWIDHVDPGFPEVFGVACGQRGPAPDHGRGLMSQMLDPTFYRSPADAIAARPERLA
jgi:hypothetical protein